MVGGLALLYVFGRIGLLGHYLEAAGVRIAFTTTAVVLAQTFVPLPFLVIAIEGAARTAGTAYDTVAATLARPGHRVVAGDAAVAGARTAVRGGAGLRPRAGEFGATLTFAGSRQGVTRTLPLEIYLQREGDPEAAIALSILLIAVAACIVAGLGWRRLTGWAAAGKSDG